MVQETVLLEGHLIDSDILKKVFDRVVEEGGQFEVLEFRVGRTNAEPSSARMAVKASDPHVLDRILEGLAYLGASTTEVGDARFAPAEADGILPDEFYSTTNFDTLVRVLGKWIAAADQKMDCALVLRGGGPACVKQGQVQKGEPVALRGPASASVLPSAAATTRSSASCPTTSRPRSTRGSRSRAPPARCGGSGRRGRRSWWWRDRRWCTPGARSTWPSSCARAGWTCSSPVTPSPCTTSRSPSSRPASESAR